MQTGRSPGSKENMSLGYCRSRYFTSDMFSGFSFVKERTLGKENPCENPGGRTIILMRGYPLGALRADTGIRRNALGVCYHG
jgi:hypothetical protein